MGVVGVLWGERTWSRNSQNKGVLNMTICLQQPGRSEARGRELRSPEGMCKRGYPAGYGGNRLQYLAGVVRLLKP